MSDDLWKQAEKFANRLYDITIEEDILSDGQVIYLVRHPELPGCKAQGTTINEAKANLDEARLDYIFALLESGLDIPSPASPKTMTASVSLHETLRFDASGNKSKAETMSDGIVQSEHKKHVVGVSLQGDLAQDS